MKKKCLNCDRTFIDKTPNHISRFCFECRTIINELRRVKNYCINCGKEITRGSKLGRCQSCAKKFNLPLICLQNKSGKNNPNYKDGETSKQHFCKNCNKEICYNSWKYGRRRCKSCSRKGILSVLYIFGNLVSNYSRAFLNRRYNIRKRDHFKCQYCYITEKEHLNKYNKVLSIHHIDYNRLSYRNKNLITLCHKCHMSTNNNRDFWFAYFTYKIRGNYE